MAATRMCVDPDVPHLTFYVGGLPVLWMGMTDNSARLPDRSGGLPDSVAGQGDGEGKGAGEGEVAGLVLLINTVLGGLGTLYVTTESSAITLSSALLVLLIIGVVLVTKRRTVREARPGRKDDWSGR
ncbi:hypothetical protein ACIQAC_36680 [Streptomyces sp. NPDC088387]|uniref:hypothetical protein n=1 Tax=Streptomyces sp. NPDC088387 TaxID=3365859 RepID=UPI0037F813BD